MDIELADLMQQVAAVGAERGGEPPWPTPGPVDGETHAAWAARVGRLRTLHDALALEGYRRFGHGALPAPPLASVTDHEVAVGGDVVGLRLYRPHASGPLPAILFVHGGAFWMGGGVTRLEVTDALCRRLADEVPAVVASLDHRLAPEHRYPAPLDDGHAALDWIRAEAGPLGIDPARIGLLGISSGGHVVTGLALRLRDRGEEVRALLLHTPLVQSPEGSIDESAAPDPGLAARVGAMYLPEQLDRVAELPYLSPVDAPDLTGLPATHLVVAELDPLTAGTVRFAERLLASGVPCTLSRFVMTHTVAPPAVIDAVGSDLCARARELLADGSS